MSEFIKEQRRSIEARLREVAAQLEGWDDLHAERQRLEAALEALQDSSNGAVATKRKSSTKRNAAGRKTDATAARGIGAKIIEHVSERPGVSVEAIAQALQVDKRVAYRNAYSLSTRGKLEKVELPGGQTGYKVPAK